MPIRKATEEDQLDFLILAKKFLKESKYIFSFNQSKLLENYLLAINHDDFLILLAEENGEVVGMLAAGITSPMFSDDKVATELAWFIDKEHRGSSMSLRLIKEYEKWAKGNGCKYTSMMDLDQLNNLQRLYERQGYSLVEKTFIKELK